MSESTELVPSPDEDKTQPATFAESQMANLPHPLFLASWRSWQLGGTKKPGTTPGQII